nr:MAG TPA: hypothetical protein [Caudoviricetes sp.]
MGLSTAVQIQKISDIKGLSDSKKFNPMIFLGNS